MTIRSKFTLSGYKKYHHSIGQILQTKKVQSYTMIILSLLTMSFFGLFALRPTFIIIAQLNKQIADSRTVDDQLTKKIISLSRLQEDYELIRGALPYINQALPSSPDLGELLSAIERIAASSQSTISALSVGDVVISTALGTPTVTTDTSSTTDEPKGIQLSMIITGQYDQLVRFLKLLVSNPRIIRIDSASVSAPGNSQTATLVFDAQAKGYYYISNNSQSTSPKIEEKSKGSQPSPAKSGP